MAGQLQTQLDKPVDQWQDEDIAEILQASISFIASVPLRAPIIGKYIYNEHCKMFNLLQEKPAYKAQEGVSSC